MMRILAGILLMQVACIIAACSTFAPGNPGESVAGTWQAAPSMLYARAAHAVVSDGAVVYALGGTGVGGKPVLAVEAFDGTAWREVTQLPGAGLNAPAAALLDDEIYVIGGFNTVTNLPSDRVLVFDVRTRAWSEATPLPQPRGGHAAIVVDRRIHVIGGGNSQSTLADHDAYDPHTGHWTSLAPLPRSEGSPAGVAFDGKLYAIGGRSGPRDFGNVDVYEPATDTWHTGPPIEPRGTAGAVVYCGSIHVFGGESQADGTSLDEALRLASTGSWQVLPPLPTPRNFARAVVFRDSVLVIGGSPHPEPSHASKGSAVVERYAENCR